MGDKNEDHVIQEAEDERGVQTETMNGHSVRGPNGVESETGGAGCSSSVEGLTLRAKLIKKLFSVLRGWVAKEVVALSRLAIPIVLTIVFQQLPLLLSLFFVGHITGQALELDSAALAIAFINITGISFGMGLASAGDTLCSQTYGSKNYKRVGHVFQRGVLILFVLCFFIWCVWLNTESLLLLFQQPPCVTRLSGVFVQIYSVSLPAVFVYIMLQKYLQAQSVVWPFIFTSIATNIVNVVGHAALIYGARLGVNGAALALVIANYCQPLFLIGYVWIRKQHKQTWDGWSWESLREWWQFLKLGLPGVVMICVEWVSFEIGALVVGSIDSIQLASNAIIIQLITMAFGVPLGIATAVSVRVGNELGAGQPQRAKRSALVSIAMTFSIAVLISAFIQSTKTVIGKLFTSDEKVLQELPPLLNLLSFIIITDQTQGVMAGVLRGCGRQFLGAGINTFSYFVGLPVGISLALATNLKTLGMWIGLGVASFVQTVCVSITLLLINWEKEAKRASEHTKKAVEAEETESISSCSTVSEDLTIRETALVNQEEPDNDESKEVDHELDDMSTEEAFLVEESAVVVKKRAALVCCQYPRTKVGLLLCRGSLFVLGAALVIGAGVSSQYHPSVINGNYSACSANDTDEPVSSYSIDLDPTVPSTITPTSAHSYSHQLTTVYSTFRTTPVYSPVIVSITPNP